VPEREKEEVMDFFGSIGLSAEMQLAATNEIIKDKDTWVEFMMKYELGLEEPDPKRAARSARNIGLSYIAGGIIPLSPYFL
jgi:VIT1/CCC1 family predicted Fe2+/Mn2+ transporter